MNSIPNARGSFTLFSSAHVTRSVASRVTCAWSTVTAATSPSTATVGSIASSASYMARRSAANLGLSTEPSVAPIVSSASAIRS